MTKKPELFDLIMESFNELNESPELLNKAIYIEEKSLGIIDILGILREVYNDGYEQGSKSVSGLRGFEGSLHKDAV